MTESHDCGKKHLRMATWIIGLVLVATISMSMAIGSWYSSSANQDLARARDERQSIELRVRQVEMSMSSIQVQLEFIHRDVLGINAKLEAARKDGK